MQATFVIQFRNTNVPFKMGAARTITAKQTHETKSEEMRGKKLSRSF